MIVVAGMSDRLSLAEVGAYAKRVEALGYDVLHVPETIHDSLSVALLALEHTSTLRVQTSLTLAFPRSPMSIALQAWDLARLGHGRFDLGLGTQIRQNIEGRFGVRWTDPIERMEDYVTTVRACWQSFRTGGPLHVTTKNYRLNRLQPFFNPGPLSTDAPEILLGGVNSRAIRLAAHCADWYVTHPTNSHPRYLESDALPVLRTEREREQPVTIVTATPLITGRTATDVEQSLDLQRAVLAFLYSTPAYHRTLELFGWSQVGRDLQLMTRSGDWSRLKHLLTDDMLSTLLPMGTWADMPRILSQWFGGLVDAILIQPPDEGADSGEFRRLLSAVKRIE